MQPLVSVVSLLYDTNKSYVDKCIESLLAQTYQNLEIIFVDDCCYCFGDNFEDVGNFISSAIMVRDKNHFNLIKSCALDTNE